MAMLIRLLKKDETFYGSLVGYGIIQPPDQDPIDEQTGVIFFIDCGVYFRQPDHYAVRIAKSCAYIAKKPWVHERVRYVGFNNMNRLAEVVHCEEHSIQVRYVEGCSLQYLRFCVQQAFPTEWWIWA